MQGDLKSETRGLADQAGIPTVEEDLLTLNAMAPDLLEHVPVLFEETVRGALSYMLGGKESEKRARVVPRRRAHEPPGGLRKARLCLRRKGVTNSEDDRQSLWHPRPRASATTELIYFLPTANLEQRLLANHERGEPASYLVLPAVGLSLDGHIPNAEFYQRRLLT